MAKKKQRKERQRERRLSQAEARIRNRGRPRRMSVAGLKPWEPVKMRTYLAPQVYPESLSAEDRRALLREAGEKAEDTFQQEYFKIGQWFEEYDALYLLAFCATYFLSQPEGIDLEVIGRLEFYAHYLEILQAFSLMRDRSYSLEPLGDKAVDLKAHMMRIGDAMVMRTIGIEEDLSDEELHRSMLLETMRGETASIRNWAYSLYMRKVTGDLADTIRVEFTDLYGVDPHRFTETLLGLARLAEDRLNAHLDRTRAFFGLKNFQDVASSYHTSFPDVGGFDPDGVERMFEMAGRNLPRFKAFLVMHSDLRLADFFTFTLDDICDIYGAGADKDSLRELFDGLSIEFNELKNQNMEFIILDNPVWRRPFIKTEPDTYFSALIGVLPHYALSLFEGLASLEASLEERYRSRKAQYLEDELEHLLRAGFPGGDVYRGSLWTDGAGKNGENDLTVVVDCVAIVVEAKSGLITPPARRGGPARFQQTVKELIEEPAGQAFSFIQLLKSQPGAHTFTTRRGEINKIDSSAIRYYIPLTVTLEQFGSLSNLKDLIEAGVTNKTLSELATVVNLTDLMVIFEILDLQSEKVHYLGRRREFDAHLRFHGDELDVLAFYLDHGFNIGAAEFSGQHTLFLSMASKQLDPYFVGKDSGVSVPKPVLAMTEKWKAILHQLELGKSDHWLDQAVMLLNVPVYEQKKFQRQFERLIQRVTRGRLENPHNWVILVTGPKERKFFYAVYPYFSIDRDLRNSVIDGILDDGEAANARGAMCIGIDLDHPSLPYAICALKQFPNLFDAL